MKVTLCSNERIKEILSIQSCSSLGPPQNNERISCTVFQCLINLLNFQLLDSFTETRVYIELWHYKCAYTHAEVRSLFLSKLIYPLIILDTLVLQFNFWISIISLAIVIYIKFSLFFECSIVIVYNINPLHIFLFLQKQNFIFCVHYPFQNKIDKKMLVEICQSESNYTKSRKLHVQRD